MNDIDISTVGWRDQPETPLLKDKILRKIDAREKSQRRRVLAFGFLTTGVTAAGISAFFLFGAAPITLAQVMEAGSKVKSFTEKYRRIMGPEKGGGWTDISHVSGDTFYTEVKNTIPAHDDGTFSYTDSKQRIHYFGRFKLAFIDGPGQKRDPSDQIPKITTFLKDFKASKVEKDFDWNGRKVTRFTYKKKTHDYDIDEELLADPQTHLPLKFMSMRDNRSWGDEWIFDYTQVDKATLKPTIPNEAKVVDLRPQREKLLAILSHPKSDVPTWLSSSLFESVLIVRIAAMPPNQLIRYEADIRSSLQGKTIHFSGYVDTSGQRNLKVNGQEYCQINLIREQDRLKNTFSPSDHLSGNIAIAILTGGGQAKKVSFNDLPATEVGHADFVVAPFRVPYVRPKLGWQKVKS